MKELERVTELLNWTEPSVKAIGFVSYFNQYLLSDYKSFFGTRWGNNKHTYINIYKYWNLSLCKASAEKIEINKIRFLPSKSLQAGRGWREECAVLWAACNVRKEMWEKQQQKEMDFKGKYTSVGCRDQVKASWDCSVWNIPTMDRITSHGVDGKAYTAENTRGPRQRGVYLGNIQ